MHNVEILAPARNLIELKDIITNGADAIYIGGEVFGMSSIENSFCKNEIKQAVEFAHERNKKVYVVVNIIPHDKDFKQVKSYLKELEEVDVDAVIISDPGMLTVVKDIIPNMEIHLSDQANTTNYATANFWYQQGIKRVVVSRELSCEEIGQIRANTPLDMDIEAFVHGAMTISYSGRSLIKNYIKSKSSDKDINKRSYHLEEQKRPGEYFPVYEDERGTFLFNSKDLCMIEYIPQLVKCGVTSLKIEGRVKDSNYIKEVVKAYRLALDEFYKDPKNWSFKDEWMTEINKISRREFTSGFYLDNPSDEK